MPRNFNYDIFLSYSSRDKKSVREIAKRLRADGLVVFDEWENLVTPFDLTKSNPLEESRTLILMMSASAFGTEWSRIEQQSLIFRDPFNTDRRFIPVRLDDTPIKDTVKQFAYVDWRNKSEQQYSKLLAASRPFIGSLEPASHRHTTAAPAKVFDTYDRFVEYVAMTADARLAIAGSADATVRVWNLLDGTFKLLRGHTDGVWGVAVTPTGKWAASGSSDGTIRVWNLAELQSHAVLRGHTETVRDVSITSDGKYLLSGSNDSTVKFWSVETRSCVRTFTGHLAKVYSVGLSGDGKRGISGSRDKTARVWDIANNSLIAVLKDHTDEVFGAALSANGKRAITTSSDKTVRVWDVDKSRCIAMLEGHTDHTWGIAITANGQIGVSSSSDGTLRLWNLETGICLAILRGHKGNVYGVSVTPDGKRAVSVSADATLRTWNLITARQTSEDQDSTRYTNAKVLLVGDSGVGKSALAIRLSENRFEPATSSSDAVWATQLKLSQAVSADDVEREIWLWDFAGQADYRLIHQLFMDETSLAILVFNPQSENPFEGLAQWDHDLERAARRSYKKLLVAGRKDRGSLMVSLDTVKSFCQERKFLRYLETSAMTGEGCLELYSAIVANIPWNDIPWTASPRIFKVLKEEIIKLRDQGRTLLRMSELKQQLEMRLPGERFEAEELRAVVGLLAGSGIVWQLEFGDFVLLQPERINAYAAAVIRKVRRHTQEIGVILEEDVLGGKLDYQDMNRLAVPEEQIVLRAMHQTFVDHGLCLREGTESGNLLVFPSYFKRERPEIQFHPGVIVTYKFSGALDEIYSTLVVKLHHTPAFEKDQLWRFGADFHTLAGKRAGIKMTKHGGGSGSIAIYFEAGVTQESQVTFIRYVHEHLQAKSNEIQRYRHYICPHCDTAVEDIKTALNRLNEGLKDIICVRCEKRVPLWDLIEQKFASDEIKKRVRELDEQARNSIDNESKELILVGHAFAIAGEAGQIFRPTANSDWGIDGEIEFKDDKGEASGKRVYLQLKSGDSYLQTRTKDGKQIFTIKNERHSRYWQAHAYPVMLVIRTSDTQIRWMNITDYLLTSPQGINQIVFEGQPFTAVNVIKLRNELFNI
jgi:small GTP-binding protein